MIFSQTQRIHDVNTDGDEEIHQLPVSKKSKPKPTPNKNRQSKKSNIAAALDPDSIPDGSIHVSSSAASNTTASSAAAASNTTASGGGAINGALPLSIITLSGRPRRNAAVGKTYVEDDDDVELSNIKRQSKRSHASQDHDYGQTDDDECRDDAQPVKPPRKQAGKSSAVEKPTGNPRKKRNAKLKNAAETSQTDGIEPNQTDGIALDDMP